MTTKITISKQPLKVTMQCRWRDGNGNRCPATGNATGFFGMLALNSLLDEHEKKDHPKRKNWLQKLLRRVHLFLKKQSRSLGNILIGTGHAPRQMVAEEYGKENGIKWCVVKSPAKYSNSYNGYVWLPRFHPLRKVNIHYDDYPIDVHGGLTYQDEDGWIGFDTNHAGDLWEGARRFQFQTNDEPNWNLDLLRGEVISLARQIKTYKQGE